MDIKKDMKNFLPQWCAIIPFQVKENAIKEAHQAFWAAKGRPSFRSRKHSEQSCFIPKTAIKQDCIYGKATGKNLFYHEALPEDLKDSRLIWRFEKWWLAVPFTKKLRTSENQGQKVVAIDPGVRSFASFYSSDLTGNIGKEDFGRIQRLCTYLDKLLSKRDLCKHKQRRHSLTKASRRMRAKIQHLIQELHHKTAKFLTNTFEIILLPTFETKDMAKKAGRKIRKKTVRNMLTFAHYQFKNFLKWKAKCTGKVVVDCDEAYTSKTHP